MRNDFVKPLWTGPAHEDRKRIRDYIAQDNPQAALALDRLFSTKVQYLTDHPELGRPGRVPGTRELVAHSNYIVVYDVTKEQARILRILHAARHWPSES